MVQWLAAVLAVCSLLALAAGQGCNVAQPGSPPDVFYPGLFDGGSAPTEQQADCPPPMEVPAGSQMPFWLGTATAAYQVEGATTEGGRGPSIWDTFAATPGRTYQGQTGAVADDFYHRYLQDIQLMRSLGIRNFRLSLSWPRLLPKGRGELNQEGVDFYNRVIDALLANCIQPHVTLYHWDLPQALEDEYKGWLSDKVVDDFAAYAETAYKLFGDRVKYWTTINEPLTICSTGYEAGVMAPGRCSDRTRCPEGNSTTEPQICAYHILLAHAAAVPAFRRLVPDGKISLNTNMAFFVPLTDSPEDANATETLNRWTGGQFLDPLFTGNWTAERLELLPADILPRFTPEQSQQLQAAKPDYLAINYYNGAYGYFNSNSTFFQASSTTNSSDGTLLPVAESKWLTIFPSSIRGLLVWLDERYGRPPVIITENGVSVPGESQMPLEQALCDTFRVDFYRQYMGNASLAKEEDGVDLQGYFAWSLLDNFEWADGYNVRFGIVYVDFNTLNRYYKASSLWLGNLFNTTSIRSSQEAA